MVRHAFSHLKSLRLSLVPPGVVDPDALATALDDLEVSRWLTRVPHPYSRADAVDFQHYAEANAGRVWTALDAEGVAGGVSTDDDLGYWVARRAWGRGYAIEMSCVVVDAWFSDLGAGPLGSGHFERNTRSRRVLDKLGFRPAGVDAQDSLSLRRDVVLHRMTLTRAGWAAARLRVAPN